MSASSARRTLDSVPPLSAAQLAELTSDLQQEQRRLTSRATAGSPRGLAAAADARSRARLLLIRDALDRIRAGSYGTCVDCRSPIAYGRLAVMPETKICVGCGWARDVQHGE